MTERAGPGRKRLERGLILNAGSSSLKWSVLDANSEAILDEGSATWEGSEHGRHEAEMTAALRDVTLPPDGLLAGLTGKNVYVDMSTVEPKVSALTPE